MHLAWALGIRICRSVLLFLAVFLYEDEEGRIQYRLETWDKLLRERGAAAHSAVAGFISGVSGLVSRFYDRLFGKSLFSLRFVGVSLCYSVASASIVVGLLGPVLSLLVKSASFNFAPVVVWVWFIFFASLGSIPALVDSERKGTLALWGIIVFLIFAYPLSDAVEFARNKFGSSSATRLILVVGILLALSVLCNLIIVAFIRWILRKAFYATSPWKIAGLALLNLALTIFLLVFFPLVMVALTKVNADKTLVGTMMLGFLLNLVGVFIALVAFFVSFLILVHRLTWPVIQRPVHTLARYKVIENKKLLWTLGGLLLFAPSGQSLFKLLIQNH